MQVFENSDCTVEVERVLYEGNTYYLLFPSIDPNNIEKALAAAGIENFVFWNRRNSVATLRIINRIGLIRLFDKEYDIRSQKFLESETGLRQFQIVLDDLASLSRHILFAPNAAPSAKRTHGSELNQPSALERFNYYRQTCLRQGGHNNLAQFIDQIIQNPHSRLVEELTHDDIWNAKRPSRKTLNSLFKHNQSFARLPRSHQLAVGRPGLNITDTNDILFPLKSLRSRGALSLDTAENRFVKFVLLDMESLCRLIINGNLLSGSLLTQCHELLNLSRSLLKLDFFQDIGRLHSIPFSSPTLGQRYGYRDLYRIFMRSRMGAKHLFDDMAEEALFVELKDISVLYEYWVFYKLATSLLKPGALLSSRGAIVKDGRIINTAKVSDGEWTIYFNRTYSRKPRGSYSVQLRPDIVIERVVGSGLPIAVHVLDAKYKSVQDKADDDNESLLNTVGVVKSADIHKMHCYIDAIEGVKIAVAVYPGTKFIFYPRDRSVPPVQMSGDIDTLSGVGAVPLMPGTKNEDFSAFINRIKSDST